MLLATLAHPLGTLRNLKHAHFIEIGVFLVFVDQRMHMLLIAYCEEVCCFFQCFYLGTCALML